ncbi:putative transporter YycB [Mycobacterium basiliense]|uniref:Putative transporter YycB n=1 Tax=Mycobacterium basiliense TaxID=2094119 RepID=A0A3S4BFH0_9MYCO|nr:MFS transporter [Mycobacterium basiliense]VDM87103.1 putative transporter YycB [Mycobacterium basiliense]
MSTVAAPPVRNPTSGRSLFASRTAVLLAIALSAFTMRSAVTSMTPLLARVAHTMGFGSTVIGVFGMLPTAMFALAGFAAPLSRRFGLERMALLSVLATAVGTAGRAMASDVAELMACTILALVGMGIANIVIPPLVKKFFNDRVALMSAVYLGCLQLGTVVPAVVAVPLADSCGWRASLAVWALIPAVALLPWISVVGRRDNDIRGQNGGQNGDQNAPTGKRIGPIWRSPIAWGLTFMFSMTSLITYAMFAWLPVIATSSGGSEALGGAMVATFSCVGFLTTLITPELCARVCNPFPVVAASALSFLVGFAGLLWAPLTAPIVWAIILGFGPSTFPAVMTLINLRSRTETGSAALSGFTQGMGYLLASPGALIFGILYNITGRWELSFGFLLVPLIALLVGGYHACKPRYLEDTLAGPPR